jgi:hypothetical protein
VHRLTLGTKPGSTFFSLRSSHSTLARDGAACMSWRLENRCSGFTVSSCNEAPVRQAARQHDQTHRRTPTCPRSGQPWRCPPSLRLETSGFKGHTRKGGTNFSQSKVVSRVVWAKVTFCPDSQQQQRTAGTFCQDSPAGGSRGLANAPRALCMVSPTVTEAKPLPPGEPGQLCTTNAAGSPGLLGASCQARSWPG